MWIQIRLLLQKQSELDLHCLDKRLLFNISTATKQMIFVVIDSLRVKTCTMPTKYIQFQV